ncbi:leucine-rich repeat domain-containing protein [Eubacteriales bacterium OttesenSCG-928-N14]|nr:leucine-rich repeat domain-containing protein [Eubacteriales bacterium OttesenSCG-928-N14]
MKRVMTYILVTAMLVLLFSTALPQTALAAPLAVGESFTVNNATFEVLEVGTDATGGHGKVKLVSTTSTSGSVSYPHVYHEVDGVYYYYDLTEIGDNAFDGLTASNISIYLDTGHVTKIGENALSNTNITSVRLSTSSTNIHANAFGSNTPQVTLEPMSDIALPSDTSWQVSGKAAIDIGVPIATVDARYYAVVVTADASKYTGNIVVDTSYRGSLVINAGNTPLTISHNSIPLIIQAGLTNGDPLPANVSISGIPNGYIYTQSDNQLTIIHPGGTISATGVTLDGFTIGVQASSVTFDNLDLTLTESADVEGTSTITLKGVNKIFCNGQTRAMSAMGTLTLTGDGELILDGRLAYDSLIIDGIKLTATGIYVFAITQTSPKLSIINGSVVTINGTYHLEHNYGLNAYTLLIQDSKVDITTTNNTGGMYGIRAEDITIKGSSQVTINNTKGGAYDNLNAVFVDKENGKVIFLLSYGGFFKVIDTGDKPDALFLIGQKADPAPPAEQQIVLGEHNVIKAPANVKPVARKTNIWGDERTYYTLAVGESDIVTQFEVVYDGPVPTEGPAPTSTTGPGTSATPGATAPATSDSGSLLPWIFISALAAAVIALLIVRKKASE